MRSRAVAAVLTALLLPLAACGSDQPTGAGGLHGTELDPPFEVSSTPLTDTDGQPYSLTKDTDKPLTMVFYGYTHCPDICQTVMSNLASAMTRLDDQDRDRVDVVFVTTDPARDTQEVLKKYLSHFDPGFIGLTGDLGTIIAVAKPMGVGVSKGQKLPSGGYDVTHGTTITGIDADDEGTVYWSEETSSADFAADIHTLLAKD
ncbi:SCO family protein [Nocardioides hankookensis]|uniref:SCO family protein n=1 Tax=Nocardioides hankookensis TaxID=443157 RepID=A0ABW1LJQ8_9ACTN